MISCIQNAMDSKMKSMISKVDHGDRVTSLMTKVVLLEREATQLKAKVSDLESQVNDLRTEVIDVHQLIWKLGVVNFDFDCKRLLSVCF